MKVVVISDSYPEGLVNLHLVVIDMDLEESAQVLVIHLKQTGLAVYPIVKCLC